LSPEQLSEKAGQLLDFLKKIVPNGAHVGNIRLRSLLRDSGKVWTEDEYWEAQSELDQKGLIGTGRGRGGGLWLLQPSETVLEIGGLVESEESLYQPLAEWLDKAWGRVVKDREDFFLVKVTASPSGRKRETGLWSRPDLSLVQVNKFDYLITPQVEASSFEVKRYQDADSLDSIYEAAAHSRWVHNSWLVVEDPEKSPREFSERFETELERFGVGLLRMTKQDDGYEFNEELSPRYQTPEPHELNEFLGYFFADDQRNLRKFKEKCHVGF
jgi:hypothetical protein